jgi:hypothetical protein
MDNFKIFGISIDKLCFYSGGECIRQVCSYFHPIFMNGYCVNFIKNGSCEKSFKCPLKHATWASFKNFSNEENSRDQNNG